MELPLAGSKSTGSTTVAPSSLNETRGKVLLSVAPFWNMEFFAIEVPEPEVVLGGRGSQPGRQGVWEVQLQYYYLFSKGRQDIERMRSHHQL